MAIKQAYGPSGQAITITLASLADGLANASSVISNTSDGFLDAWVQLKVKTNGSTPTNPKIVNVYAYASADGGTSFPDGVTGTAGAATLVIPPNSILIGSVNCPDASTTYISDPMSVAAAFGGNLPEKWGIIVENRTGNALDSTAGSHAAFYQGVFLNAA